LGHDEIGRLQGSDGVGWIDPSFKEAFRRTQSIMVISLPSTRLPNYEVRNERLASNVADGVKTHSHARMLRA
jgi:hypothetical protein